MVRKSGLEVLGANWFRNEKLSWRTIRDSMKAAKKRQILPSISKSFVVKEKDALVGIETFRGKSGWIISVNLSLSEADLSVCWVTEVVSWK